MANRDQNERLLRKLMDVFWNEHRLDAFEDFFAEDVVLHSGTQDYSGRGGLGDAFAAPFFAAFPDLHHAIVYLLVDGDWAAMRYHGTGTLTNDYGGVQACGQKLDYHGTVIFQLAQGRIAEVWGHSDLAEWIAAQ
jgi:steroid delta-isomerase-like uncharacterized protein